MALLINLPVKKDSSCELRDLQQLQHYELQYSNTLIVKIQVINGPNLNLLGKRETSIYGSESFEQFLGDLKKRFPEIELHYYQSNVEGELVNKLHEVGFSFDGIILNAGAYTHTSVAIHDAIAGIKTPVVEVHISNVYSREEFRHKSLITSKCIGLITGFGLEGYAMALTYFKRF